MVIGGCQSSETGGPADLRTPESPGPRDFGSATDLAMMPVEQDLALAPDLAMCTIPVVDTGRLPTSFALNTATFFSTDRAFVCRDSEGLYTMTSSCTHAGCDVRFFNSRFSCPCHGSRFSFNGAVTNGPASSPLRHYLMMLSGTGTVSFAPCMVVADTERYNL